MINESFKLLEKSNISWVNYELLVDRIDSQYYSTKYVQNEIKLLKCGLKIDKLESISEWVKKGIFDMPAKFYLKKREEGIPFIRISNIKLLEFDTTDLVYIPKEIHKKEIKTELNKGDIVISKIGSIGNIGIINEELSPCNFSQNNIGIKMNGKIDSHYLATYMISKYCLFQLHRYSTIQVQSKLNLSDIRNLIVPIPSPEIQKYIGDKVRKAEELREEAKRLKKEAEEIFFNEINIVSIDNAFKKEQHIKFNWINIDELDVNRIDAEYNRRKYTILVKLLIDNNITLIPISNLLEEPIVSGSTPKGGNYIENGIPFVRATNLCEYSIDDNLVYISKEESDKLKNSEIRSGDVVFSIAGSIGVASIIPSYIEKANINQALVRLRLNNINKYYFVFVVNSSIGRLLSLRLANGAVQLNLNREEVGNIMVPRINDNKEEIIANKIKLYIELLYQSKQLIQEAKQDVEDLIEGNFDMSKVKANN